MKNIFKRAVAVMLCGAVSITLLSGCSAAEMNYGLNKNEPVSVVIWDYYNGAQQKTFEAMVSEFNSTLGAEKGIIVESSSQGNVNELTEKVMNALDKNVGSGKAPDVVTAYADTAYAIDKRGLAADIGKYLTKEEKSEYIAAYLEEGKFDNSGSLKLFPTAKSTEIMMLNTTDWKAFSTETGASTDAFKTWEGLCAVAKKYYEWTDAKTPNIKNDGKAFFGRDAMANYMIVGSMQLGTELFSVSDGKVTYQVSDKVMRKLWDNYYTPYVNGYYASVGRFRTDDVKTGDIIALVGSTSGSTYFPQKVTNADGSGYEIESAAFVLPNFEGTKPFAVQQGAGMLVTKSDEKREYAATVFLKWFTEKQNNLKFCTSSGYLPVKKEACTTGVIKEALAAEKKISLPLSQSLEAGIEVVQKYSLYTNKAFEKGAAARAVVNDSLQNKCDADLKLINEQVKNGADRASAAAKFTTDENFNSWLADFKAALNAA